MRYGCIGRSLVHSYSPEIHSLIGQYDYELLELPETALFHFLAERDFSGINVTMPYKQAVIPLLDHVSKTATEIGAVNTIVNRDGLLFGYNTDFSGLLALIRSMNLDLSGKKVLILGTGGTSRTARAASAHLGAMETIRVSRKASGESVTYEDACRLHGDADIIINTTPCGMYPDLSGIPLDLSRFSRLQGVVDVVYNPLSTRLVLEAEELGIPARGGLRMLVAQAVAAAALFTGSSCPADTEERILQDLTARKRNLVLTGMPGSGKTALGLRISEMTGRPFVDLDETVVRKSRKPISRIFAEDGEAVFRDAESGAVREVAGRTGLVIATGGGCILRQDNVRLLKMNGTLVFLDRALEDLTPSDSRPLSDSREKLFAMFESRYSRYLSVADCTVPVTGDIGETAKTVIQAFMKEAAS